MELNPILLAAGILTLGGASAWASCHDRRTLAGALKMAAATGYILLAVTSGAIDTVFGRSVLLAFGLCWMGDLLLIRPGRGKAFLGGLVSFLLGHLAYTGAFYLRGVEPTWSIAGGLAAGVLGVGIYRWIMRHDVPGGMRLPVALYVVAITAMVALSVGTYGHSGNWLIPTGALSFMISDIFVARERFVLSSRLNVGVGLPLYFFGQVLLALAILRG
jgi:uncharacterized membrane protein YhhN